MISELLQGWYWCRSQIAQCFKESHAMVFDLQISKLIFRVFLIDLRKHDQIIIVLQCMHQQPEEGNQIKLQQQEQNLQPELGSLGYEQIMQDLAQAPNDSIEQKIPSQMMEQQQQDDIQGHIRRLNAKTEQLHADEQFLKQELKVREKETLQTFSTLMAKKKQLVKLVQSSFNRKSSKLDLALTDQFEQMRKIILGQQAKLEQLHTQIRKQGLAGVLGDESSVKIKNKTEQMEKQIKVGRKFSSTQYVRDYLERPQAYKVSYQQAKYEYELRLRVKQCLEQQKLLYQKKKEELNLAKKKQRERQQQLHKELDYLKS